MLLATRTEPPYARCSRCRAGWSRPARRWRPPPCANCARRPACLARIIGFNQTVQHIARDAFGRVERHYVILSFAGGMDCGRGADRAPRRAKFYGARRRLARAFPDPRSAPYHRGGEANRGGRAMKKSAAVFGASLGLLGAGMAAAIVFGADRRPGRNFSSPSSTIAPRRRPGLSIGRTPNIAAASWRSIRPGPTAVHKEKAP